MTLKKSFINYLINQGLSVKSLKNYKSDYSLFSAWLIFKVKSVGSLVEKTYECIPFVSKSTANEYKKFLLSNNIPSKTLNRRLSTLRHLGRFLFHSEKLSYDFASDLKNIPLSQDADLLPLVPLFKDHLIKSKVSHNTIKNYLSDIKQFISWLEVKGYQN
ncbi:MAG: site-specific integrase [Patescibacteria group bacterium]